jgi:hypothetical protein
MSLNKERRLHLNTPRRCTHIKVTGHRCGSPALKGEYFCYFHTRIVKGYAAARPDQRLMPAALIEDGESLQVALMELIDQLYKGMIDPKHASLILRALHIGVKNIRNIRFDCLHEDMVTDTPDYHEQYRNEHPEKYPPEKEESKEKPNGKPKDEQPIQTTEPTQQKETLTKKSEDPTQKKPSASEPKADSQELKADSREPKAQNPGAPSKPGVGLGGKIDEPSAVSCPPLAARNLKPETCDLRPDAVPSPPVNRTNGNDFATSKPAPTAPPAAVFRTPRRFLPRPASTNPGADPVDVRLGCHFCQCVARCEPCMLLERFSGEHHADTEKDHVRPGDRRLTFACQWMDVRADLASA